MKSIITTIVASLMLGGGVVAETYYVNDGGSIQAAIDSASDGDEIIVGPGTYTSEHPEWVVKMQGKQITLRSSDGPEVTTIDGEDLRSGIFCNNSETTATIIDGFTITNGNAANSGGGIRCDGSGPTIQNCRIINNHSHGEGGGIFMNGTFVVDSAIIQDCVISGNTANGEGAGIACFYGSPIVRNCSITGNESNDGGGMAVRGSTPSIQNCHIHDNTAFRNGGGIQCYEASPLITGCTIAANTGYVAGGGIYTTQSNLSLQDSFVCSNDSSQIVGFWKDVGSNVVAEVCPWYQGACCTNDICVVSEEDDCDAFGGSWLGVGTTCADSPCPSACLGDADGNGGVNIDDLLLVIARFGVTCP